MAKLSDVVSSNVGLTLFNKEAKELQYKRFVQSCNEALSSIWDDNWKLDDVKNFHARMAQELKVMKAKGQKLIFKKKLDRQVFGCQRALRRGVGGGRVPRTLAGSCAVAGG